MYFALGEIPGRDRGPLALAIAGFAYRRQLWVLSEHLAIPICLRLDKLGTVGADAAHYGRSLGVVDIGGSSSKTGGCAGCLGRGRATWVAILSGLVFWLAA